MPDRFDLRGSADGFHRSADRVGVRVRRLRQPCWLSVTGAADHGRHVRRLCPYQLPCRHCSPCKESPAPDLPWRLAAGTASWGSTRQLALDPGLRNFVRQGGVLAGPVDLRGAGVTTELPQSLWQVRRRDAAAAVPSEPVLSSGSQPAISAGQPT